MIARYELELRVDGKLIGDIRELAEGLKWSRKRTRIGVDQISFTLNDRLFARWCAERGTTIADVLRPLALDCRVIRNGVAVVGGYLATMPAYAAQGQSASLSLNFDGYLNFLAGVYLYPQATNRGRMGALIKQWIDVAEARATAAGKGFGFKAGTISTMATVEQSIDNYTAIRDIITNRCDNTTGAGPFDFYVHPDRTYDVVKDSEFGNTILDYVIQYPTKLNGVAATAISAKEVSGFASTVIGIGAGEIGEDGTSADTAIVSIQTNAEVVKNYGYAEITLQESSVSVQGTLDRNTATELRNRSSMVWQPEIKLLGTQVNPTPEGPYKIWIGDTVTLQNTEDYTDMTSGNFRVNSLDVSVDANGAEEIVPTLSRGDAINTNSFAKDFMRIQRELLALKTAR